MASPSYWHRRGARERAPFASELPRSCTAVVIGGGVIGVACAYALAVRGLDVILLEAEALAAGASGSNGGFVIGTPRELERLRRVLARERIDCDYTEPGHLALASSPVVLERFQEEARRRDTVEVLDRAECEDLVGRRVAKQFCGGRWQPRAGLIDPVRLVAGLARGAVRRGAMLAEGCVALRLTTGEDGEVAVETSRGEIRCAHAVVACQHRSGALVPELDGLLRQARGEMLASTPVAGRRLGIGMAIDFGFVYWRQQVDGTFVVGGRDAIALPGFLSTAFPGFQSLRPHVRWSGLMDETPDGAPLLGRTSLRNVWLAAGFGGHGIPPALAAGEAIARAIAHNRPPAVLDRLAPARFTEVAAA